MGHKGQAGAIYNQSRESREIEPMPYESFGLTNSSTEKSGLTTYWSKVKENRTHQANDFPNDENDSVWGSSHNIPTTTRTNRSYICAHAYRAPWATRAEHGQDTTNQRNRLKMNECVVSHLA